MSGVGYRRSYSRAVGYRPRRRFVRSYASRPRRSFARSMFRRRYGYRSSRSTSVYKRINARMHTENGSTHKWPIPKLSDRAHYVLEDEYSGTLDFTYDGTTGAYYGGMIIPTNIVYYNLESFNAAPTTYLGMPSTAVAGNPIAVAASLSASRQPGLFTAFARYRNCIVTGASMRLEFSQDEANPGNFQMGSARICVVPMGPQMISELTSVTGSPAKLMPGTIRGMANVEQLPYAKAKTLATFAGSRSIATFNCSIRHAKFMPMGYYNNSSYWVQGSTTFGTVPTVPTPANTAGFFVYIQMPNLATGNTVNLGLRIRLKLYCTYFNPRLGGYSLQENSLRPPIETKEEKKDVEPVQGLPPGLHKHDFDDFSDSDGEDSVPAKKSVKVVEPPRSLPPPLPTPKKSSRK